MYKRFGSILKPDDYVNMANSQFNQLHEIHMLLPTTFMSWSYKANLEILSMVQQDGYVSKEHLPPSLNIWALSWGSHGQRRKPTLESWLINSTFVQWHINAPITIKSCKIKKCKNVNIWLLYYEYSQRKCN